MNGEYRYLGEGTVGEWALRHANRQDPAQEPRYLIFQSDSEESIANIENSDSSAAKQALLEHGAEVVTEVV